MWNEHLIVGEFCPHCFTKKGYKVEIIVSGDISRCALCMRDLPEPARRIVRVPIKLERKGRVVLCCVHGRAGKVDWADHQIFAVGKPKGTTYFEWWEHDPGLAPTSDLVTFAKRHPHKGSKKDSFQFYMEQLLDEWSIRKDFTRSFSRLLNWLKAGKTVAVACYCDPGKRDICHLSILRGLIEDFEYEVTEAEPIWYR